MSFKITLKPSGHQFELDGRETILRAGMRSGFNLAHNCMNGSCGKCLAKLVDGDIEQTRHHDFALSDQQKQENQFLTCCYKPSSDLVLQMHELDTIQDIPYQEISVKVSKTERLSEEVLHLQLRASRSQVLDFLAGQKVQLCLKDGTCVQLGIASCPCDGLNLRFHVSKDGDEFSRKVFKLLKKGEKLLIKGPFGGFVLNEDSDKPLIFIAWETGFSQVQSIIDHVISETPDRCIQLYWLAEKKQYLENYCRAWNDVLDNFHYESVICSLQDISNVLSERLESIEQLLNHEIYTVLPAKQLKQLRDYLDSVGVAKHQFISEAC